MGGALSEEALKEIIHKTGIPELYVVTEEVTDAYAMKWGHGLMIKEFIQTSLLIGKKKG